MRADLLRVSYTFNHPVPSLTERKKSAAPVPMKPTPLPGPTHASPPQHAQHTISQLTPSPPMHSPS